MIGLEGTVKLKIEEYLGKESNKVSAYLYDENKPKTAPAKVKPPEEADSDHIPF